MKPADLARLFADEAPHLLRRLRRFRGRVAAEDVVQSAFTRMLEVDMAKVEDPRAYLARLTQNLAIDEVRRQGRAPFANVAAEHLGDERATDELTPEQMLLEGERFAFMTGAVLALPERERLALLLFKLKGLSHAEIGQRLRVSRHSVPRLLSRALAKVAASRAAFERGEAIEASGESKSAKER